MKINRREWPFKSLECNLFWSTVGRSENQGGSGNVVGIICPPPPDYLGAEAIAPPAQGSYGPIRIRCLYKGIILILWSNSHQSKKVIQQGGRKLRIHDGEGTIARDRPLKTSFMDGPYYCSLSFSFYQISGNVPPVQCPSVPPALYYQLCTWQTHLLV